MKNVLYILGKLTDDDIEWMIQNGTGKHVAPDDVLIVEGQRTEFLYVTFEGQFGVFVKALDNRKIAELGPGEIIGEMSFVEYFPPSATVRTLEAGYVLCIPRDILQKKLEEDTGFAARFYQAIAVMLSDRLRSNVSWIKELQNNQGKEKDEDIEETDEIHLDMLEDISRAGSRFDRLVRRVKGL